MRSAARGRFSRRAPGSRGTTAPQPQTTGCRPPTVVLASTGGQGEEARVSATSPRGARWLTPTQLYTDRAASEAAGGDMSSRDEERTRRRPGQLTGEGPDALSSDLSSSNVRSKDVTAFSFDDVQSFIVL